MPERPTPDSEPFDGLTPDGNGQLDRDVSDDELASALAALFEMSPEAASGDPPEPSPVTERAPAGEDASEWAPPASLAPNLFASEESPADAAGGDDERSWWDPLPVDSEDQPPPFEPDDSAVALRDAGFGGPLHSALGELGRIIPDRGVETPPAEERTQVPVPAPLEVDPEMPSPPGGRRPQWLSADGLRQVWLARRRDWGPALIVAALIAVAFVVVLTAGGPDGPDARIDTRSDSSSVTTTTADVSTTLFEEVPPLEVPVEPDPAAVADGSGTSSAPPARPLRRRPARVPATS
ncbi:MAG TPA: hypothetical protein VG455_02595, partial [Acidimicrobiales bacterium]|nr:hypothetical protein [Acidimicrobiales bacterium]